jgi:Tfp pilus assembly protein PilN
MRAVNLLPAGQRPGAGGAAGRSGGAAYVLVGTLAALVVMVLAYTLVGRSVDHKRDRLASVQRQAAAAESRAAALKDYSDFGALRAKRLQTVQSIAASRFDWAHAFHELARVLPSDVALSGLTATVAPGVPVSGGASVGLRGAIDGPAIEMGGCTRDQAAVARMLTDLRRVDGVRRVSLQNADRGDGGSASDGAAGAAASSSGSSTGACGDDGAQFQAVIFFDPKPAPAAPPAATAGTQATSATTTTSTTGATR